MRDLKYHYLYCITNMITSKLYVGVHSTQNLHDNYMGSGRALKMAIKKYGIDNFKKDYIKFFDSDIEMYSAEREIVNENFVTSSKTYNMMIGGNGGFPRIDTRGNKNGFYGKTHSEETRRIISEKSKKPRGTTCKGSISKLGEKNPMFGKLPANAKSVVIDGVSYKSIKEASIALDINYATLKGRFHRGKICQV